MPKKFFIFCLSLMMTFFVFGCKEKIKPGNKKKAEVKKINTRVQVAKIGHYPLLYEAVGTINAGTSSMISSKVFGIVKKIYVHEGTRVKKGDLLAKIDDSQAAAQLANAMAGLAGAKKALAAAQASKNAAATGADFAFTTFKRYKKLLKEKSVSPQEFDDIRTKYHQAKAALSGAVAMIQAARSKINQAKAGVAAAKIYMQDTRVIAPYSGGITKKIINVGDLASPGVPLFSLETYGKFQVEFYVPEKHIDKVHLNQQLTITIPSMDNIRVKGVVVRIDPAADPLSRSFNVKLNLPETPKFRSGVFARIALPVGSTDMILIPETAVIHHGELTGFYLVDNKKTAHFRLIRTGRIIKNQVEVISGIHPGDHYIVHPPLNMENNVIVGAAS